MYTALAMRNTTHPTMLFNRLNFIIEKKFAVSIAGLSYRQLLIFGKKITVANIGISCSSLYFFTPHVKSGCVKIDLPHNDPMPSGPWV
jgi:hypothetical protein